MTLRNLARCSVLLVYIMSAGAHAQSPAPQSPQLPEDKYLWLEDVSSARSMDWVNAENTRSSSHFEADPRFAADYADALRVLDDPDKLAMPGLKGDVVYNNWRDKDHPRGLFRRTSLADYLTPTPHWQPVLDVDALNKAESAKWVPRGVTCLYPGDQVCLAGLSNGGEDAVTEREFDLKAAKFVDGGFVLPHSKQSVSWQDKDTLLVAREWGPGTLTNSGYPFVVKRWKRGTPLESAAEIFRGQPTDEVGSSARVMHDASGHRLVVFHRGVTFFTNQTFVETPGGLKQLAIPPKAGLGGMIDGQVLIDTHEDWTTDTGAVIKAGSLAAVKLEDLLRDPAHLKPEIVFTPSAKEFMEGAAPTPHHLLLTTLDNVQGRAYLYSHGPAGWTHTRLAVPENSSVGVVSTDETSSRFVLSVTSFLTPTTLYLGDAATGSLKSIKTAPARFDASRDTVEQLFATSKDGTRVPYFVVHPKDMKLDGSNPTVLTAYGGFEVSETPSYSAITGKLWLEKGGVFVLANIRGGGEFGPAWHEAGLKTKRQVIYDDFAAVGEDLIRRKITSTPHLGIQGGSNGGLLMGVEMTERPDLWGAVIIEVPLLDMMRIEKIAAGASWSGEYGSVSHPDELAFWLAHSPYNQLKPGVKYPEPFIWTTTKDDRVGPQHARKFAAKMAEFHEPFYFYEVIEGGHGSGADSKQTAHTDAMNFVYLKEKLMK
ncbi:prolyl oligopeptidase family serine peptidase [Granulicella tundricola]|uniref:Prolyl oligopeptidase n=1 Tax=Granulicella tundricola (strain ATCC BAA-1859 / DSM 23138 / MP5ACTX9) TaxID=1198114 RepID=E8X0T6_GRATM|nr:prolyl oligopeptidase family serine peptidase [Granulicella tundricola]ADW70120.1 Prolyl oligopeptidase [Granulicella tundricola MP5ACTX9]